MGARILLVGSGGREHAIAWKLAQSPEVSQLILAPGNDGMEASLKKLSRPGLQIARWPFSLNEGIRSLRALALRAKEEFVDLTVIGPDDPLALGIVDVFQEQELMVFGPTRNAARIEASKAFAKDLMKRARIPTAEYRTFERLEEAQRFLKSVPWPNQPLAEPLEGWVVKADGLALGKGVQVCDKLDEALIATENLFRISGKLVIERRLSGVEISWMALCDGDRCVLLPPARDYKRAFDSDQGPNTGGMGALCPVPGADVAWARRIHDQVFAPALAEMKRQGCPFKGVLFAGLMVNPKTSDVWVLEFNSRFGDPETQVILPLIAEDLYPWLRACAEGRLSDQPPAIQISTDSSVVVIAASQGYPEAPISGKKIKGPLLQNSTGSENLPAYFIAAAKVGTRSDDASAEDSQPAFFTTGGRVLGCVGLGKDLAEARARAYRHLSEIEFEGLHARSDIATQAVI